MKRGEIAKKLLLAVASTVAVGGFTLALAVMPGAALGLKPFVDWYRKQDKYGRYRIRKTFAQLRRERLIEIADLKDGKTRVILTESGKKRVLQFRFEDLQIIPRPSWDKKWRMVIFDIPELHKKARNALREKLQSLGFYPLQKSVWIYPHECKNEIDFIIEFLNVSPYVRMAEAISFDGDHILRKHFEI